MDIRKLIRRIISEVAGVQIDLKNMSEPMADMVIDKIIVTAGARPKILNGRPWTVKETYFTSEHEVENTKMDSIAINIQFINSSKKDFEGQFNPSRVKTDGGGTFSVELDIQIQCPFDDLKLYGTEMRSILSHELSHAFVYIHDVNKRAAALNSRNHKAKGLSDDDPGVQLLSRAIYLSNPMEIQARIQDIGGLVSHLKSGTAEDALSELLLYRPMQELAELNNMDFRGVEHTQAAQDFVARMGKSDVKQFIATIDKKRKTTAFQALKKVYRLVSDRYRVNEEFWIDAEAYGVIHESDWPPR